MRGRIDVAQLIVRGLPDWVVRRLEERAAKHGWSAEEEHRRLLERVLLAEGFGQYLAEIPAVGDDGLFERRAELPRKLGS